MNFYQIAGLSIAVHSDLPIKPGTFAPKFVTFQIDKPGDELVHLHHHFELPEIDLQSLGAPIYHKTPWAIYPYDSGWLYLGILPEDFKANLWKVAIFNVDHSIGHIYHPSAENFISGNVGSLTGFPTDQIWLARLLAERNAFYIHSASAIINGKGILFVGHSEAGKSTTTQMLLDAKKADLKSKLDIEVLCDDRNILRLMPVGWQVYGSWSHGDIPIVSENFAPAHAMCFLEQAKENALIPISDRQEIIHRLLACVIKPFETTDWWERIIDLSSHLSSNIPCFTMQFDRSGSIIKELISI